jgi:hypothetical protein
MFWFHKSHGRDRGAPLLLLFPHFVTPQYARTVIGSSDVADPAGVFSTLKTASSGSVISSDAVIEVENKNPFVRGIGAHLNRNRLGNFTF